MQSHLSRKVRVVTDNPFSHRPPICCFHRRRPLHLRPHATEGAPTGQPFSSTSESGGDTAESGPSAVTVVEATVVDPDAASETSTSSEAIDFPEPPLSANRAAALQYGLLGAVYAVVAGATAFVALRAPQALLPAASAADPWAATLLGCMAATFVRAAGVFLHLQVAANNEELLCLRHQRLAAMTAVYGVVAVASQVFGVASVPLLGLQLLLATGTAAVVVKVARTVWAVQPFISVAAIKGEGGVLPSVGATLRSLVESLGTVAGLLLLVAAAMSMYGFGAIVLSPAPEFALPLGSWPGQSGAMDAAAAGLRRLAGCGLLLLSVQAHGLLDFAGTVRLPPDISTLSGFRSFMVDYMTRTRDRLVKYYLPFPNSYSFLNLGFVLGAALQAFFVLRAPSLGVDVNLDSALWGPMYATWVVSLLYGLAAFFVFDWEAAGLTLQRTTLWVSELVLKLFNNFVWQFQWAERVPRK